MVKLKCTYCGKEINKKSYHPNSLHHFCSKQCEGNFRKNKPKPHKKINVIELREDFAIIHIENAKLGHFESLIDIEDIDKIKNYYWGIRYDNRHPDCLPYVETHIRIDGKLKRIHLHRLITDCPDKLVVDHLNHNNLDNRKYNLKICSQKINTANRKDYKKRNLPLGIYTDERCKQTKYAVYFQQKRLGTFLTLQDAQNYREEYIKNYLTKNL